MSLVGLRESDIANVLFSQLILISKNDRESSVRNWFEMRRTVSYQMSLKWYIKTYADEGSKREPSDIPSQGS